MSKVTNHLRRVRIIEGYTPRTMARRLGIAQSVYDAMESDEHELTGSELTACSEVLCVPVASLLGIEEPNPFASRAAVLHAYKSAVSLKRVVTGRSEVILLDRLIESLHRAMPELNGEMFDKPELHRVTGWPEVGQRRSSDELGVLASRSVSDRLLPMSEAC